MRRSILVVLPTAPWPPRENGLALRFYPLLDHLTDTHDVDLVSLADPRSSLPEDPLTNKLRRLEVHEFARTLEPSLLCRALAAINDLLPWTTPRVARSYVDDAVHDVVARLIRNGQYEVLLWGTVNFLGALARDVTKELTSSTYVVLDCVDSPSLHLSRSIEARGDTAVKDRYGLWKLSRWERRLGDLCDRVIYTSHIDAAAAFSCPSESPYEAIPNGVYLGGLRDSHLCERPLPGTLGFFGNMSYPPNVRAALRLHDDVFQPLTSVIPGISLRIIGRSPDPSIQRLASSNVTVTGAVDDIWEAISRVAVFVFPFDTGAGLQNKLLEAMYIERPVVTTTACSEAVGACDGREVLVGSSNADLRDKTLLLLTDPALASRLASRGRRFVEERFSGTAFLEGYSAALLSSVQGREPSAV